MWHYPTFTEDKKKNQEMCRKNYVNRTNLKNRDLTLQLMEKLNCFPFKIGENDAPLPSSMSYWKTPSQYSKGRKEIKSIQVVKEELTLVIIHRQHDCLYRKFNGICKKSH